MRVPKIPEGLLYTLRTFVGVEACRRLGMNKLYRYEMMYILNFMGAQKDTKIWADRVGTNNQTHNAQKCYFAK